MMKNHSHDDTKDDVDLTRTHFVEYTMFFTQSVCHRVLRRQHLFVFLSVEV